MNTDREDIIRTTVHHLRCGSVILYPTDTVWGLGCDPFNAAAVERIFRIKRRDSEKAFLLLVSSMEMLMRYVQDIPEPIRDELDQPDAPLTVVYDRLTDLPAHAMASDGTVGIRIVQHPFIRRIIDAFDMPIVSTSANTSRQPTPTSFDEVEGTIKEAVDYIVPAIFDMGSTGRPSRLVIVRPDDEVQRIR